MKGGSERWVRCIQATAFLIVHIEGDRIGALNTNIDKDKQKKIIVECNLLAKHFNVNLLCFF